MNNNQTQQPAEDERVKERLKTIEDDLRYWRDEVLINSSQESVIRWLINTVRSLLPVQPAASTPTLEDILRERQAVGAVTMVGDVNITAAASTEAQDEREIYVDYERDPVTGEVFVVQKVAATTPPSLTEQDEELAREQIVQAITDIQEARLSHLHWAEHFEAHPEAEKQYESTGEWDNAKVHREWVEKYDNVLAILARFPFAYLKPVTPNRDYTKHPELWLRERGRR